MCHRSVYVYVCLSSVLQRLSVTLTVFAPELFSSSFAGVCVYVRGKSGCTVSYCEVSCVKSCLQC